MKIIILTLFVFAGSTCLKAQYVNIPDSNFRKALEIQLIGCFNAAGQLDTSCVTVKTISSLFLQYKNIISIEGIEYFPKLTYLNVSFNQIKSVSKLPDSLQSLYLSTNQIKQFLFPLPDSLKYFACNANYGLKSLPALPSKLVSLECGGDSLFTLPFLPSSLEHLDCTQTQLTFLPALPDSLKVLMCGGNNISNLPSLPFGIKEIDAAFNKLSTLPTLPLSLKILYCRYNLFSSLPTMPDSLESLLCEENSLTSLPALPVTLIQLNCSGNPLGNLPPLPPKLNHLECRQINMTTLPTLPDSMMYLYISDNPITCIPYLPSKMQYFDFQGTLINCVPNSPANCQYYPSTIGTCNPTNNANHCQSYPQIYGFVYNDNNSNGTFDSGDVPRSNIRVKLSNGMYGYSNDSGYFNLTTDTIGSFTIDVTPPPFYSQLPISNVHNFTSYTDVVYDTFALQPTLIIDSIAIHITPLQPRARPGFDFTYAVQWHNAGTTLLNVGIKVKYDSSRLVYDSSSVAGISVIGDSIFLSSGNILQGQLQGFKSYFHLKPTSVIGDKLRANATAKTATVSGYDTTITPISGSYDPNSKQSTPNITPTQIAAGGYIEYLIHFQNTGTDTAFDIVIADTLSPRLRSNFLQVIQASHPCSTTLGGGIVTFKFLNINLPDSNTNLLKSKGYVRFRIKPDSTLVLGDSVGNKCSIYFDYNTPFTTNTTQTHIFANVLPLSLLNYTAKLKDKNHVVNEWTTVNEVNTSYFNVQRGKSSRDFLAIGKVNVQGRSASIKSYNYTDEISYTVGEKLYYRLEIIDRDGKKIYSPTQQVVMTNGGFISIYPNPAHEVVTVAGSGIKTVNIADNTGRLMMSKEVLNSNKVNLRINALTKGLYILKVVTATNETKTEKLIVE